MWPRNSLPNARSRGLPHVELLLLWLIRVLMLMGLLLLMLLQILLLLKLAAVVEHRLLLLVVAVELCATLWPLLRLLLLLGRLGFVWNSFSKNKE